MRKVSPSEWTGPWPPFTGAQITFGPKRPQPSKEELARRGDLKMMKMSVLAILEKDPKKKEELQKAADEYWAKRRVELGFTDPEEAD